MEQTLQLYNLVFFKYFAFSLNLFSSSFYSTPFLQENNVLYVCHATQPVAFSSFWTTDKTTFEIWYFRSTAKWRHSKSWFIKCFLFPFEPPCISRHWLMPWNTAVVDVTLAWLRGCRCDTCINQGPWNHLDSHHTLYCLCSSTAFPFCLLSLWISYCCGFHRWLLSTPGIHLHFFVLWHYVVFSLLMSPSLV